VRETTSWPSADWSRFLSVSVYLYEVCEACRVFPGLVSPSHFMKIDLIFSDAVCAEIDKGLAQYVRWYEARSEQQQKVGKHKFKNKYETLNDLLGVTEEQRRGGWTDGSKLTEVSGSYKDACIAAAVAGKPMPDVTEWLAKQRAEQESDEDDLMY
jgi:hypothetical protein